MNDVFNVGGVNKILEEIAEGTAKLYNVSIKHVPWPEINKKIDGRTTVLDNSKIERITKINYENNKI